MDALGTKQRWKQFPIQDIIENWEGLIGISENTAYGNITSRFHSMNVKSFSDTLVISFSIPGNKKYSPIHEIEAIYRNLEIASTIGGNIFVLGLSLGIFFRECISYGDFYETSKTILGDPINEAAEYYEQPNWIGLSLAPSAYKILQRSNIIDESILMKYDIPLKNGVEKNGFAINMLERFTVMGQLKKELLENNKTYSDIIHKMNFSDLDSIFHELLNRTQDVSALFKIRNTLEFISFLKKSNYKTS